MPGRFNYPIKCVSPVSLVDETFSFPSTKLVLKFKIPRQKCSSIPDASPEAITRAVKLHSRFRLEVGYSATREHTIKNAKGEVGIVLSTFPYVYDPVVIASMSAWYFLLCYIDDIVENMSPGAAQDVLREIPMLLANSTRRLSIRRSLSECDEFSRICHSVYESSWNPDDHSADQIRDALTCFRRHMICMMSMSDYEHLCDDITPVFEAMVEEISFRQQEIQDLPQYMSLRERTIGLGPLFNLLRLYQKCSVPCSERLAHLQLCVHLAVGMQNDVVGLEKDVIEGEYMNYPTVHAGSRGGLNLAEGVQHLEPGILEAVEGHNMVIELAMGFWNEILEEAIEEEVQVASSMLVFVARHFRWATESRRYKG